MKVIHIRWFGDNQDCKKTKIFNNVKNITTFRNDDGLWLLLTFKRNSKEAKMFDDGMFYVEYNPETDGWGVEL